MDGVSKKNLLGGIGVLRAACCMRSGSEHFTKHAARSTRLCATLALVLGLTGCLSRPNLVKESFAFSAREAQAKPAPAHGRVVAIHSIGVAPPFDSQSFNYRTGEYSYERDPYAQFLVPPAETLEPAVRDLFRQSGAFAEVTEPESTLRPDTLLEVYVEQLYGDFRDRAHPAAVLSMHLLFVDAAKGRPGRVLLQKDYTRRVPLRARTAAALVKGWNQALEQIVSEAATDLQAQYR